jgi:hypothetical protein
MLLYSNANRQVKFRSMLYAGKTKMIMISLICLPYQRTFVRYDCSDTG